MTDSKQPNLWVGFALDEVPGGAIETYRLSHRPLAGPVFIEGRLPADGWQDMVRRASAFSGEPAVDSITVNFRDSDNKFRYLLTTARRWFKNRLASVEMLSDTLFATATTPAPGFALGKILMVGRIRDFQPEANLMARMEIEDILSGFLDKTYPQWTFNDAYPYRFVEQPEVDATLNEDDPGFQILASLREQVIPIYYGPFIDTETDPITGLPRGKGMCKTWFMGYTYLTAGTGSVGEPTPEQAAIMAPWQLATGEWDGWGELAVGLGELQIPNVYASDLTDTPRRQLVPESNYGVDVLAPGHAGWPFATDYVMRNGIRMTVIYARGPLLWAHITNTVNITVDTCGWPSALAPFNPITQAGYAWIDFLIQHVFGNYKAGPSDPDMPTFGGGDRTFFWSSKIAAWQVQSATRIGTAEGYLISMALTSPITLREIRARFNRTFGCHDAKNGAGQLYLFSIEDTADPTVGVRVRERIELKSLPGTRIAWEETKNVFHFTYGWDPEQEQPRTISRPIRNQPSIQAEQQELRLPESGTYDLMYTADNNTALDVMGRLILRVAEAPRYQNLPVDVGGVDREIGEPVRVSHRHGLGAEGVGFVDQPMVIMGMVQRKHDVMLECVDVGRMIATGLNAPIIIDEEGNVVGGGGISGGSGGGWGWDTWPT